MNIIIPEEVKPYELELKRFVESMVYKLKKHSGKGKWSNYNIAEALTMLEGELNELREAVNDGNTVEVMLEAADVANYAMIITAMKLG